MSDRSGEVWRGASKSHFASSIGVFPTDVTGKTIYITSIHNAQTSDVTISMANQAASAAETTLTIVKAGTSFTPETPIGPLTEGRPL